MRRPVHRWKAWCVRTTVFGFRSWFQVLVLGFRSSEICIFYDRRTDDRHSDDRRRESIDRSISQRISLSRSARRWWREIAAQEGRLTATRRLMSELVEFVRHSTPEHKRLRYGDAEFDWDHRVNTTSGAVGWRDRLLGVFHSPYQPTEEVLFHEMLGDLSAQPGFNFSEFTFLDLGSGKGRSLLMAADYPFRRIVGVELLPALNRIAEENIAQYHGESQKCFALETVCGDATAFSLPQEPTLLFLFNPFPESGLRQVIANLEQSLLEHPRVVYVLYHNPLLGHLVEESSALRKVSATHQYTIFSTQSRNPIEASPRSIQHKQ
jgi:SAM-dependent methyltransferase